MGWVSSAVAAMAMAVVDGDVDRRAEMVGVVVGDDEALERLRGGEKAKRKGWW